MKKSVYLIALMLGLVGYQAFAQKDFTLLSPDKSVKLILEVADSINYSVAVDNKEVVGRSKISFTTDASRKAGWKVVGTKRTFINELLTPVVRQKSKSIQDRCNQLHLDFGNGLSLECRAYNNGVAWRWITSYKKEYKVLDEKVGFSFDKNGKSWFPEENSFFSHNERTYKNYGIGEIDADKLASLPVLFESNGIKLLLTESGLYNYAGLWVRGNGEGQIQGVFPFYPKETKVEGDRNKKVTERENFIAKLNGPQQFPWRVLMIARQDNELLENQLVYQLSKPARGDFNWVKPGKVQWDWWNYNNIYEVDFRAGINTETYKYYIDFASKYGIEYVLLDEGWGDTRNLLKVNPDVNIEELVEYGREKKVDILLWVNWLALDNQLVGTLEQFAKWGIKGIKVDFMQRDDQEMVNFYERVASQAAKYKLLVDFHGAYKPVGMNRTYPNVMTSEGVFGNEQSKGDGEKRIGPDHNLNLPFIRMAAGPMDYTPGAMINAQKDAWKPVGTEPMSLGTRCHQLAMYVVYESPLQMLCDSPTHYYKESKCMEFLKSVPAVWDTTLALSSKVGNYVLIARKANNGDWYMGAMTNWSPRKLTANLSFLGQGKFKMYIWQDGINADRNAKDFKTIIKDVDSSSDIAIDMAKGGGWVARIVKADL